ncbi:MAG: AFG1 family ATPase [Alphaproteobacteria bacterium]|nr:MAG: AFG1 family ATPase [Alphaproteobacteria bacterium]
MESGPLHHYRAMIEAGELQPDPAQLLAVEKLQLLANRLSQYDPPDKTDFFSFFTRKRGAVPEGLYLFGGVGRGKTMLMDLFFETVPFAAKRRVHFHEFMAEVHELIARFRKLHEGDPIPLAAQSIASDTRLLCFDELHVTDIADAMILGRLFSGLFEAHVVVVATSNAAPRELYADGLNRPLFEPFIDLIEERMEVLQLEAATDYRLEKLEGTQLYFTPADAKASKAMRAAFKHLTGHARGEPAAVAVKGRKVEVPEAAMGVAWFDFADLCARPLGASDFLAIAHSYHTLFIENIPVLSPARRNEARRFINLIDTLYDSGVRLVASAQAEPDELYREGDGAKLFERTASRLVEMRSHAYLSGENHPT